jgi:chromate transporter
VSALLQVIGVFALLSLCAIGGGTAVLPEMKALTVHSYGWLTEAQFRDVYSLGQVSPGPNMLMVTVIGYRVAGFPGALAATVAFFLPAGLLMFVTGRVWDRFEGSPWRTAVQRGLAPMTIGLMLAGVLVLARTAISGPLTTLIALASTAVLMRTRLSPPLVILGGGIVGWMFLS